MPDGSALIILTPSRGSICFETFEALSRNVNVPSIRVAVLRKPVVEARNALSNFAIDIARKDPVGIGFESYVALWIDDDAWFDGNAVPSILSTFATNEHIDVLAGLFCAREPFCPPAAYNLAPFDVMERGERAFTIPSAPVSLSNYRAGDVIEVDACGAHFLMHRVSLLTELGADPWNVNGNCSEDNAFCKRVKAAGHTIAVATGVPIAHVDVETGLAYLPYIRPLRVAENRLVYDTDPSAKSDEEIRAEVRLFKRRSYGAEVDDGLAHGDDLLKHAELVRVDFEGGGSFVMPKADFEAAKAGARTT